MHLQTSNRSNKKLWTKATEKRERERDEETDRGRHRESKRERESEGEKPFQQIEQLDKLVP